MAAPDPQMVPLRDALVGRVLRGTGDVSYYLGDCIGEGGQGWVFRASWDDPSGHVVIVKVLRPDVVGTEALKRFTREADVLRMLSTQGRPNPYIVRFYDHAVAQVASPFGGAPFALPFTVLEYVDGTTLEKVLAEQAGRGFAAERTRRLLRQICQALDIVHAQKVVHRDLKPSNILLATEAGTEIAKVTDFGLVKLVEVNLQRTAALAGASLGYAPVEQYEQGNQRVGPRTDVFSLAAVTYEMLSGKPAFPFIDGENPLLIVTRIMTGPRPTLMRHRESLASELQGAPALIEALDRELGRALASDPEARHASIMDFWRAIEPPLRAAGGDASAPRIAGAFDVTARTDHSEPRLAPHVSAAGAYDDRQLGRAGSIAPPRHTGTPGPIGNAVAEAAAPRTQKGADPVDEAIASNPASWSWTTLTTPLAPGSIRGAAFRAAGDGAVALSSTGLMRWERGAWMPASLPPQLPRLAIRGLQWLADGTVLFFGERGLVGRIAESGAAQVWHVPDAEIIFLGAHADPSGVTTLVGERPYRGAPRSIAGVTAGVVAQFTGDRVTLLADAVSSTRLRAVTRLRSGALVACGDWGVIERVERGVVEHIGSICGGHLACIAPTGDGAVTVGVGGHALSLSHALDGQLEAVQTTRDILSLATSEDGQVWAGSAQARLLRRTPAPTPTWMRMNGDIGVTSNMIAIWAAGRSVRAIGDDGVVVDGRIT